MLSERDVKPIDAASVATCHGGRSSRDASLPVGESLALSEAEWAASFPPCRASASPATNMGGATWLAARLGEGGYAAPRSLLSTLSSVLIWFFEHEQVDVLETRAVLTDQKGHGVLIRITKGTKSVLQKAAKGNKKARKSTSNCESVEGNAIPKGRFGVKGTKYFGRAVATTPNSNISPSN